MSLRQQASSLTLMHAAEALQPLLVLPYAGRVLGPHGFGQYAYAVAIGQFAATIVEYGFHWTAQRSAAAARQERAALAALFAEVFAAKVLLCLAVTVAGLVAAGHLLALSRPMFLCAMLTAFGGILFPGWLFIGLERARQAAIPVIVARVLALVLFVTTVTSPAEVGLAVAIQSAVPFAAGLLSLPYLAAIGLGGFRGMTWTRATRQLRLCWRGFLFSFVERASMALPVPFIEHFAGYVAAGQYSVAEKFVGATRLCFRVISETLLPRVAYYAQHAPDAGIDLILRSLMTLVAGSILALGLFFVAPWIILVFFGDDFRGAIPIVRAMAVIPPLVNANLCTANLYMFNYGHERAWSRLTLAGLLLFLFIAYVLAVHVTDATTAVVAAAIAKEALVLSVSVGFFLVFGVRAPGGGSSGAAAAVRRRSFTPPPAATATLGRSLTRQLQR